MNKEKIRNIMIFAVIFIIALILLANPLNDTGDDIVYKNAFNNLPTFFTWAKEFCNLWGGRVIALGLCTVFLNINTNIYILINASVLVVLIYSIYKLVNIVDKKHIKNLSLILLITMSLLLCINKPVIDESIIWVTGAFNYLWPCVALIISMIPFLKILNNQKIKVWEYIIYFLSLILACNIEQTGAVLIVFSTLILILSIIKKNKIPKLVIFNYILSIIIFFISFKVKGNDVRYEAELLRYFQDFNMLSILDKVFIGTSLLLDHLINKSTFILLIISIALIFIAIFDKDKKRLILSLVPFGYCLLKVMPLNVIFSRIANFNIEKIINHLFFNYKIYSIETICNPFSYIQVIIGVFVILLIGLLIFCSFKDVKKSIVYILIYFAGICSSLALSVSPTIFASGYRIFFINDIMNVIIGSALINEISKRYLKDRKNGIVFLFFILFIIFVGFINLLNYIEL